MDAFDQTGAYISSAPPPPLWRARRVWILAAGALAVIALGGLFWWFSVRGTENTASLEDRLAQAIAGCDSAQNPDACRAQGVSSLAKETGSANLCLQLKGQAVDGCFYGQAFAARDAERCQALSSDVLRAACADAIHATLAQEGQDASSCAKITDANAAQSCADSLESQMTAQACRKAGKDPVRCDAIAQSEAAQAKEDPDACATISVPDVRGLCFELTLPGDRDHDGLNASEESLAGTDDRKADTDGDGLSDPDEIGKWQTNPLKADTDGDGHSDGGEVGNGYNPLGAGRL